MAHVFEFILTHAWSVAQVESGRQNAQMRADMKALGEQISGIRVGMARAERSARDAHAHAGAEAAEGEGEAAET